MNKELNKLKIWVSFLKFFLGSVVVGGLGIIIDASFTDRELEMKEMDQVGKYLNVALSKDIGVRKRFSEYFASTLRSEEARDRWKEYDSLMTVYYDIEVHKRDSLDVLNLAKENEKIRLEDEKKITSSPKEKEELSNKIERLENDIHDLQESKIKVEKKLEVPEDLIERIVIEAVSGEKDELSILIIKFLNENSKYCYSPEGIRNIGGKRKNHPYLRNYSDKQIEAKLEHLVADGFVTHNCKDSRLYRVLLNPEKITEFFKN